MMTPLKKALRILIVEDSRIQARILRQIIEEQEDLKVVAIARDGDEALSLTMELAPDLITMDVRLPNRSGYEATQAIMVARPTPILVVADLASRSGTVARQMLAAGALEVFPKPHSLMQWIKAGPYLLELIRALASTPVKPHSASVDEPQPSIPKMPVSESGAKERPDPASLLLSPEIIAIVSSTGGPRALLHIIKRMPADYPIPIVIVQHIAEGFAPGLVRWLGQNCTLPIRLVEEVTRPVAPGVYIAPDNRHLLVAENKQLVLSAGEPVGSIRPRGDILLSSVAHTYGSRAVGIVLTGMGDDGAQGMADLHRTGAFTIAQDKASSTIYGMPKVAAEKGVVTWVLSLEEITTLLLSLGDKQLRTAD